mgnify:CR=1 FL=1
MSIKGIPLAAIPPCLKPETPIIEALHFLVDKQVNHAPVCSEKGVLGIVSINDILMVIMPVSASLPHHKLSDLSFLGDATTMLTGRLKALKNQPVSTVAHFDIHTLEENCPLMEAALLLSQTHSPLPVVDSNRKLLGVLSRRALVDHLMQKAGV